ncbi:ABC transporter substrate-binding protein [Kineosporia succinea]|uniref:Cellobiose transport system substrate-binding protein n=1 Tax=Kineosporia succinea TaxID=84632 RepID=A0ABT9P620_9ACTN|nr:extracellular solute-binding protein [Kineosporia succinea]MDP9827655.1 cellobiose transport system substrate-binding protein [Kineosporia succinea]
MSPSLRGARQFVAVAAVAGLALTMAACGSDEGDSGSDEQITLKVSTFGTFGYDALYKEYEASHPNVKIVESNEGDLGKYTNALTQRIAAGSGAGDVVAIEEGAIIQFLQAPDKFVNFQDEGFNDIKDNWLEWKNVQATTADGKATIGLGTDVGGLAMCYRTDLFKAAGLPTDREEVSKLWPTWDDYIATGEKFLKGAKGDTKFVDSATNTYNSILMQYAGEAPGYTYFDQSNNLTFDSNPAVKNAWDTTNKVLAAGLSANLKSFTTEWNAAFKQDKFATIACPAWMTANIKGQAGADGEGKWDIATIPGGSGSWGGSFLAVPTQSKHQEAAVELAKFLSSPEGQMSAFDEAGNLPSSPKNFENPALADFKNEYFSDAPVAEIFVEGAKNLKPVFLGAKNQAVRDAIENDLRSVEQGQRSSDEGWQQAIKSAKAAAGV